jgi:aldehyde:ferredoxin oxidoreductase
LKEGASQGHFISKEELETMLNDYYTARGWAPDTGVPSRIKLTELGLEYVADQLGA